MFTIRKATSDDCKLINELANQVFPATYRVCIYNRLLLNILQLISQKYGRNF